jgi:NTE family protein
MPRRRSALGLAGLLLCGCVTATAPPVNRPLAEWDANAEVPEIARLREQRSGELLLALTFSGGGTRSAAFAYGVLEALAATDIVIDGQTQRLLDEVDVISSVSGGSFTAAYYGLFGERIFADFERVFLRRNVQRALGLRILRPRSWLRLLSSDRSNVAARYYHARIFERASFGEMRGDAPVILINATDLATGSGFRFTQPQFDMICSDLAPYPVARAVAASSAVPVVFSTVKLENFAGTCGFEVERTLRRLGTAGAGAERLRSHLEDMLSLQDREARHYVHLIDGGIADNLGLRAAYDQVGLLGPNVEATFERGGHRDVRLILVLVVNAETLPDTQFNRSTDEPSASQVLGAVTTAQLSRYNVETLALVRESFEGWAQQLSRPGRPVAFQLIELGFEQVEDARERAFLQEIETSFNLSDEKVDRLIAAGRQLVHESVTLRQALTIFEEAAIDD